MGGLLVQPEFKSCICILYLNQIFTPRQKKQNFEPGACVLETATEIKSKMLMNFSIGFIYAVGERMCMTSRERLVRMRARLTTPAGRAPGRSRPQTNVQTYKQVQLSA